MERTILEKRIREQALDEIREEWRHLVNICYNGAFAGLKVDDLPLFGGQSSGSSHRSIMGYNLEECLNKDYTKEKTNFQEIIDRAIEKRVAKKTDDLLCKMENLGYLFNKSD